MKLGANIRLREDGRYEARYFKGRSDNGRARYGSVYDKTPEEADKNRTELLKSLQSEGDNARLCRDTQEKVRRARTPEALDEDKTRRSKLFLLTTQTVHHSDFHFVCIWESPPRRYAR